MGESLRIYTFCALNLHIKELLIMADTQSWSAHQDDPPPLLCRVQMLPCACCCLLRGSPPWSAFLCSSLPRTAFSRILRSGPHSSQYLGYRSVGNRKKVLMPQLAENVVPGEAQPCLEKLAIAFISYVPGMKKASSEQAVNAVCFVVEKVSLKSGDGRSFVSHKGNEQTAG